MQVLIVDHNPDIRTAMRLLLTEKMQVDDVLDVSDLKDLNKILLELQPEIILLDWELPGFSAQEHLPQLCEKAPVSCFVIVSSKPETKKFVANLGLNAFIGKYQSPDAIVDVLNKCQKEIVKLPEQDLKE
jgi:DNA-binding NarL/FixJ family response regulator